MRVETAILTRLVGLAPVTALAGTRVYLDVLPQAPTYPCVRVSLIDELPAYHARGPVGVRWARVQVDAFAAVASGVDPYDQAEVLAEAIEGDGAGPAASGLSGWIGEIGSPALSVLGVFRATRTRLYDPDELRVVTMSQDFIVWYRA